MHTKDKRSLGEAMVMADLIRRGHKVALPVGENSRYDLIVDRDGQLERVQVKYTESDGIVIAATTRSTNNWQDVRYDARDFEWLTIYDRTSDRVYDVPSRLLGDGRTSIDLRLRPTRNRQVKRVLWAGNSWSSVGLSGLIASSSAASFSDVPAQGSLASAGVV